MSGAVNKSQIEFPLYGRVSFSVALFPISRSAFGLLLSLQDSQTPYHMINELWEIFSPIFLAMPLSTLFSPHHKQKKERLYSIDWITDQINLLLSTSLLACNRFWAKKKMIKFMAFIRLEGFSILFRRSFNTEPFSVDVLLAVETYATTLASWDICGVNSGRGFSTMHTSYCEQSGAVK